MSQLKQKILSSKIQRIQIDPFGYCNAKCWFCPVKYIDQPENTRVHISIELIEKIFINMIEERNKPNGLVHPSFDTFLTAHYNEVLLYKDFEKLLELGRKYKLKTFVLSNGVALSKQKVDLIKDYRDVVTHIGLNIPAFERKIWAKRSGFTEDHFDRLISNLRYASDHLDYLGNSLQIHVNGVDRSHISFEDSQNSRLMGGDQFDHTMNLDPGMGEHQRQYQFAKMLFPKFNISKNGLMDRAGYITNIMSNQEWLRATTVGKKVVGCSNWGDRITEWIHVNSLGETFLCCNDYNFDYKYGDFNKQTIREMWGSDQHIAMIERALDGICTKCVAAKFE